MEEVFFANNSATFNQPKIRVAKYEIIAPGLVYWRSNIFRQYCSPDKLNSNHQLNLFKAALSLNLNCARASYFRFSTIRLKLFVLYFRRFI